MSVRAPVHHCHVRVSLKSSNTNGSQSAALFDWFLTAISCIPSPTLRTQHSRFRLIGARASMSVCCRKEVPRAPRRRAIRSLARRPAPSCSSQACVQLIPSMAITTALGRAGASRPPPAALFPIATSAEARVGNVESEKGKSVLPSVNFMR